jgi:hypothetical protein
MGSLDVASIENRHGLICSLSEHTDFPGGQGIRGIGSSVQSHIFTEQNQQQLRPTCVLDRLDPHGCGSFRDQLLSPLYTRSLYSPVLLLLDKSIDQRWLSTPRSEALSGHSHL